MPWRRSGPSISARACSNAITPSRNSSREDEFGRWQRPPADLQGTTQSAYIIVADADAHFARAKAAGAQIVLPIKDEVYGGRVYSCRDPEGHLWNFGTYDPWRPAPAT